jgi:uncharacterized protein YciI
MTRWVAIFDDAPGKMQVRADHRDAHFAYLEANMDRIKLGGAIRVENDDNPVGGLWILETETREEAVKLCEEDPFHRHGLRSGYRLLSWGRGPCFGPVDSIPL